jgi:hypothetical protein
MYRVTDTREITTMTQGGGQATLYRVWLITERGASGTIDVPLRNWNKDDLPAILNEKALALDLAFSIASGG